MEENKYMYKGFDFLNESKKDKLRNEYFNPYGYNIYSTIKEENENSYNITHMR